MGSQRRQKAKVDLSEISKEPVRPPSELVSTSIVRVQLNCPGQGIIDKTKGKVIVVFYLIISFSPGTIPDACIWFLNLDETRPEMVMELLKLKYVQFHQHFWRQSGHNTDIDTDPLLANIAAELGLSLIASVKRAIAASHSPCKMR